MQEYEQHIVAHAIDPNIRLNSSSGGFCKSFLVFLVEKQIVDNIILTRMKENDTSPESIITNQKNQILTRTNSIYEYHNQLEILSQIKTNETYAFIGLPCFTNHIRKQQQYKNKYQNIKLLISLFCNQAPTNKFKQELLKDNKINNNDLAEIDYRHGKHPGKLRFCFKDQTFRDLNFQSVWSKYNSNTYSFAPPCCLQCSLYEGISADISVGDPWNLKKYNVPDGWSKVIVRNELSMNLIELAKENNYIYYENEPSKTIACKQDKLTKQHLYNQHRMNINKK